MNRRIIFIIALVSALLLHSGAGIIMLQDEKDRIQTYLQEDSQDPQTPSPVMIELIPEDQFPPMSLDISEDAMPEEIERAEESAQDGEEEAGSALEETQSIEAEESAAAEKEKEKEEDSEESSPKTPKEEKKHQAASYQQNISKGGDLMRENILPPREEGGYSRTVTTNHDPYQKLVENAIALLEDTPFLDKEWKDQPEGEDLPTYYSPEFIDLLKKYNPSEPIHKAEEPETEEPLTPDEGELSELDRFGNPKPVTLIVNQLHPPIDLEEIEALAEKKALEKERIYNTNLINAAGSQIRRQEYNVALTSTQCYDNYIKGSHRKYSAIVMILDDPKGTGIYKSTGNLELDSCIIEMTNQFIQIPAEMERIRRNAPRMGNGKGYLLNATF